MRDYKKEYARYQGKPEQIKRRSARNQARRKAIRLGKARKGDGKDVHHRDNNPKNNGAGNLSVTSVAKNRGYPRDRNNKPKKGLSNLAARIENLIEFEGRIRKTTKGKNANYLPAKEGAGMTKKGVAAHRRANPGSKLQTAVTGKVKRGSKAAARRKSFCARSKGWTGERGKAARRRWKCAERVEGLVEFSTGVKRLARVALSKEKARQKAMTKLKNLPFVKREAAARALNKKDAAFKAKRLYKQRKSASATWKHYEKNQNKR